ncbi:MAG TPA: sigma-54 dependent transcriptional regulator [Pirellulaceae bacterium]|nr:sigma-54 dependent transcriptional regulator [Pirellulaceae bacterium]
MIGSAGEPMTSDRGVLVVDDHAEARRSVVETLELLGFRASGCESPREALRRIGRETFDLIITDLMMPGMDGIRFLGELQQRGCRTPTLMVTAHGSVETAVRAMRAGAFDYLEKPFDVDQLEGAVRHALERGAVVGRRSELPDPRQGSLIGDGPAMTRLKRRIAQVAGTDVTILITGESGTGKELVARAIHLASARRDQALVSLNCPALSPSLMESELFGHEQGAFTNATKPRLGRFELAHRGTIFLDEVTEIEAGLQAKLLRVLQERTFERVGSSETRSVDVRVIAATNRNLEAEVAAGRFREDLYFRLNVIPLEVPPLRERPEDLPDLARHLLARAADRCGRSTPEIAPNFFERLAEHRWPGNVRELENLMTRVVVLATGSSLTADDLDDCGWRIGRTETLRSVSIVRTAESEGRPLERRPATIESEAAMSAMSANEGASLEEAERRLVEATLAQFEGHRERTARALGIGVRTLSNKLRAWGYRPRQGSYRDRTARAA